MFCFLLIMPSFLSAAATSPEEMKKLQNEDVEIGGDVELKKLIEQFFDNFIVEGQIKLFGNNDFEQTISYSQKDTQLLGKEPETSKEKVKGDDEDDQEHELTVISEPETFKARAKWREEMKVYNPLTWVPALQGKIIWDWNDLKSTEKSTSDSKVDLENKTYKTIYNYSNSLGVTIPVSFVFKFEDSLVKSLKEQIELDEDSIVMNILCLYKNEEKKGSFPLSIPGSPKQKHSKGSPLFLTPVSFDSKKKNYTVPFGTMLDIINFCIEECEEKSYDFVGVNGKTKLKKKYDLFVDQKSLPEEVEGFRVIADDLIKNFQEVSFKIDLIKGERQKAIKKFIDKKLDNLKEKYDGEDYWEEAARKDFPRTSWRIQKRNLNKKKIQGEDEVLYTHLVKGKNNSKQKAEVFVVSDENKEEYKKKVFELVEKFFESQVENVSTLEIKKNIVKAFATRSQNFDANPFELLVNKITLTTPKIFEILYGSYPEGLAIQIGNDSSSYYTVTLSEGSNIMRLQADFILIVQIVGVNGQEVLGYYKCQRDLTIDISTGEMSEDSNHIKYYKEKPKVGFQTIERVSPER